MASHGVSGVEYVTIRRGIIYTVVCEMNRSIAPVKENEKMFLMSYDVDDFANKMTRFRPV